MDTVIRNIIPYLNEIKHKGDEIIPKYCPFCMGGQNRDRETFAINTVKEVYKCMRGSCGEQGHITELAKHLGVEVVKEQDFYRIPKKQKKYVVPKVKTSSLSKPIIDYFSTRGITHETLEKNKVTEKQGNIVFNYYKDNEIVFIKYKIPRKQGIVNGKKERKSWREADTRPILYGMDECDSRTALIICEGEPDKLVLDECGIMNAVSIPSGTEDFNWIEECWEWLEQFKEIILWADNDIAGKGFIQEAISRLDQWKLRVVECKEKDINVLYYKASNSLKDIAKGRQAVAEAIDNSKLITNQYVIDLADVKRKDYRTQKSVSTGFSDIDELIGGFYQGQLVIWTGYNGSGKSTALSNILLNGIEKGNRAFAYSGELTKEDFKEWMDLQLSGVKYLTSYECPIKKATIPIPDEKYYELLDEFYEDRLFLFDSEDYATDKELLKAMEYMAKREGIKTFLIDNMLTTPLEGSGDMNERQSKYVNKLKKFARKFNAIVHLVAHPRKPAFGQTRVDKYSISGTANITDLADRVIGIHKISKKDKEENDELLAWDMILTVFKDRKFGVHDEEINFKFEYFSKRFYRTSEEKAKLYSWTKRIKKYKQATIDDPWSDEPHKGESVFND